MTDKEADDFVHYLRKLPDSDAACTTGPGFYYNDKYIFPTTGTDADFRPVFAWLVEQNPVIDKTKFSRLSNRVRSLYNRARQTLKRDLLAAEANPPADAKYDVINDMGEALNLQLDSNPAVFQQTNDITAKLRNVGLEIDDSGLYGIYLALNKYYNATKHRSEKKFLAARAEINTLEGKVIAAKYYDAVRRILEWYFRKYFGITADPELSSIDYSVYGINI